MPIIIGPFFVAPPPHPYLLHISSLKPPTSCEEESELKDILDSVQERQAEIFHLLKKIPSYWPFWGNDQMVFMQLIFFICICSSHSPVSRSDMFMDTEGEFYMTNEKQKLLHLKMVGEFWNGELTKKEKRLKHLHFLLISDRRNDG